MAMPVAAGVSLIRTAVAVVSASTSIASTAARGILHARTEVVAYARGGRSCRRRREFPVRWLTFDRFSVIARFDGRESVGVRLIGGVGVKLVSFAVFVVMFVVVLVFRSRYRLCIRGMARLVVFLFMHIFTCVDRMSFVVRSFFVLRFGEMFGEGCRFIVGELRGGVFVEGQMRLIFGEWVMLLVAGVMRLLRLFRGEAIESARCRKIKFVGVNGVVAIFDAKMLFDPEQFLYFIGMRTGKVRRCGLFAARFIYRFGRQMLMRLPFRNGFARQRLNAERRRTEARWRGGGIRFVFARLLFE